MNAPIEAGRDTVVVGVDGSEGANHALAWAAAHVEMFGRIHPVVVWHYPWWAISAPMPGAPGPPPADIFAGNARDVAEQALASIKKKDRDEPVVCRGHAGETLVTISRRSSALVVGTRGRGAFTGSLLGSTSAHCVAHAEVPVIVVPEAAEADAPIERVVVGVDGSDNSVAALVWALEHIPADAAIDVVHAWSPPGGTYDVVGVSAEMFEAAARDVLETTIKRACDVADVHDREVTPHLEFADPRAILREHDADLLVVGARGHRGVAHLLLGSTASGLIHHPRITTVVVPDPHAARTP